MNTCNQRTNHVNLIDTDDGLFCNDNYHKRWLETEMKRETVEYHMQQDYLSRQIDKINNRKQ